MTSVPATTDAPLQNTTKDTMAQKIAYTHENDAHHVEYSRVARDTTDNYRIHIVEDEEEDEEDLPEDYEDGESEDEVDESVIEDMRKLEESFRGISRKYRLINRIGEGEISIPSGVQRESKIHLIETRYIFHCIQSRAAASTRARR